MASKTYFYVKSALAFLERANTRVAMILPPVVAGTIAALIAYYAMEVGGTWKSPGVSWGGFIPGWLFATFFTALATVCFAYLSHRKARQYPATANIAAITGSATILALTWWPTQQCDAVGGVAAGLMVAAIIAALAAVINSQAGKVRRNIVIDSGGLVAQKNADMEDWYIGIVPFAQIALASFMVVIVLMAFTSDDLAESRTKLLTFAGIGITAASIISAELSLKNILAIVGVAISTVGAYLEMDQALVVGSGDVSAAVVLLVAGIAIWSPLALMASRTHSIVRILIAPLLRSGLVICTTLFIAMFPAMFISNGCGLGTTGMLVTFGISGLVAVAAGIVMFVGSIALELRRLWLAKKATTTPGNNR